MRIKDWFNERINEQLRKIIDQIAHFLWAFIALIPVLIVDNHTIGGGLSGLLIALPRELVDQWPIGHWKDTLLDLTFFTLGGLTIGHLLS